MGLGPEVLRKLGSHVKMLPSVNYYVATLASFFSYVPVKVKVVTNDWKWSDKVRVISVANGKYFGHGLCVAPDGNPGDGVLNVFLCGRASALDFIRYSAQLKKGKYISLSTVSYRTTTKIELTSDQDCPIEADGEIIGKLPVRISILPQRLSFL